MRKQIVKDKDISILLKGAIHLEDKDAQILLPEQCAICPEAITGEGTTFKPSGVIPPLTEVPANTVWYSNDDSEEVNCWGWHEDDYDSYIHWDSYNDSISLYIGEGLTEVSTSPSNIHYIHLPESVNHISAGAFAEQYFLRVIDMPSKVESIGSGVFANCLNLKSIYVPEGVTELAYGPQGFFECCFSLKEVMLPETLLSIGNGAFDACYSLTSITIPNSVTSIGHEAFEYCSSLTSITIPNSVTSIGDYAFSGCSSLTSIVIPNNVTSIGGRAFINCSSLTSITIGNSVTSIGDEMFSNCSSLTSITWNAENCPDFIYGHTPFSTICSQITEFVLGDKVQHIPAYLCRGMEQLTSITIPESVTSIGDLAFYDCYALTSLTIPNSVTSIGGNAFSNTPWDNNQPKGIVYINNVLYKYKGSMPANTSIDIKDGTVSISPNAFLGCSSLTSITIPNSVTSIGGWAFSGCSYLTSITIPNSVTYIGYGAFGYCYSLTSITCEAITPPTLGSSNDLSNVQAVYVPAESVEAYKTATNWSYYTDIIQAIP